MPLAPPVTTAVRPSNVMTGTYDAATT
jgi:hypothetical protein